MTEDEISTRRVEGRLVHEMADLGVDTMCGKELLEPWTYTDKPVNCSACKTALRNRCGLCHRKRLPREHKGWTTAGLDARCPDCSEED